MIHFADSTRVRRDLLRVLDGGDYLHACIFYTYYRACGWDGESARFWVYYDARRQPRAGILQIPNEFLICDAGVEDVGELAEFLRFMHCTCLCARAPLLNRLNTPLGLPAPQSAPAMVYRGGPCRKVPGVRRAEENLREIYSLIRENYCEFDNFGNGDGYDNWLSLLRLKARDSVCGVYALYEGGEAVATASICAASAHYIDLGTVVTRRDSRGRGFAALLCGHLIAVARESGLGCVLGCANEELERYYSRMGFERYDRWAASELPG